jgi:hypothetical protein
MEVKDKKELAQIKYINELTKKENLKEVVRHALVMQQKEGKIIFTSDGRQARFMFVNYNLPDGLYKIIEEKNSCAIVPAQIEQDYPNVDFLVNWDKDPSYQKIGEYRQFDRNFVSSKVVVDILKAFPEGEFIINAAYIYSIFKSSEKEFKLIHGDYSLPAYFNGRSHSIIFKGDKVISIVMVSPYRKY